MLYYIYRKGIEIMKYQYRLMIIDQKGQKILFVHSFNSDEEMREQLSEWYPCCKILSLARFNSYDTKE